uniref:EF-hand domain-containing protein n=1 Tax=Xenopus tropicalis TaxID=8364 RepID=A0A6I8R178_XENTR
MAAVESAVYSLLEVFHKYSAKEGDQLRLNRSELGVLLSQELPLGLFLEELKDAMSMLDLDGDGEVDFLEFIEFITEITTELQEMYLQNIVQYNRYVV